MVPCSDSSPARLTSMFHQGYTAKLTAVTAGTGERQDSAPWSHPRGEMQPGSSCSLCHCVHQAREEPPAPLPPGPRMGLEHAIKHTQTFAFEAFYPLPTRPEIITMNTTFSSSRIAAGAKQHPSEQPPEPRCFTPTGSTAMGPCFWGAAGLCTAAQHLGDVQGTS